MKCETCKYWDEGLCRRYPAQVFFYTRKADGQPMVEQFLPSVSKHEWCGEYRPKDTEEAE